jgi:hypothetical protein
MALADNKRLYDLATRHQIYIEGVKVWHAQQWDATLRQLSEELKKILSRIKYETLDSLTKVKLTVLMADLRAANRRVFSLYSAKVLKQLEQFTDVDLKVNRKVYATAVLEEDDGEPGFIASEEDTSGVIAGAANPWVFGVGAAVVGGSLWSRINNSPIPANGQQLGKFLALSFGSVQNSILNTVTKAYANKSKTSELMAELFEGSARGTGSVIERAEHAGASALGTSIQHIAQMVSASITSGMFGRYCWYSVIDSSTTQICFDRNLNVYVYGKGPIPPAHVGCRSHIAPIKDGDTPPQKETFAQWFKRQTGSFRADVGSQGAKFAPYPLTADDLLSKIAPILSR